jgi:tRNA threonylcarbamoyladenosine biosynthesis protein TsaE
MTDANHYDTATVEETKEYAARFGAALIAGDVVVLRGELGAGKTQFAKGIARAFWLDEEEVASPTFALVNEYDIKLNDGSDGKLYHLDCYRFEKPEELLELGVEEYLYPKQAISIIEWPERIEHFLPLHRYEVHLEELSPMGRKITITKK